MFCVIIINIDTSPPSIDMSSSVLTTTDTLKHRFSSLDVYTYSSLHLRRVTRNINCLPNKLHPFNSQRYRNGTYLGNVTHDYHLFFAYISSWTTALFL